MSADPVTPPPRARRSRLARVAVWLVAAVAVYGLAVGVALPPLAKKLIADKMGEKLGRTVALDRVAINPFNLTAHAKNFRIMEPDGTSPFVSFDLLDIDASAASVYRLAPVVDNLTLTGLKVNVVRDAETHFNFSDILERLARAAEAKKKEGARDDDEARFSVSNIRIIGARVDLDDRPKSAKHQVSEMDIAIPFISNLPTKLKEYVKPAFSAKVNGADLRLAGETLPFEDTLRTHFTLALDAVDLRRYLEYSPVALPFKVEGAMLDANISVRFTQAAGKQPSVDVAGTAALRDVAMRTADGPLAKFARLEVDVTSFDPVNGKADVKSLSLRDASALGGEASVPVLDVHGIAVDLKKKQARIASVATRDGSVALKRNRDGSIELPRLTATGGDDPLPSPPPGGREQGAWDVVVAKATVTGFKVVLADAAVKPAVTHRATIESLELEDLATRNGLSGNVSARIGIGKGGTAEASAVFTLEPLVVNATLDVRRIDLVPLRPYVPEFNTVALNSGAASAKGKATLRRVGQALHVSYRGGAEIANLATVDTVGKEDLLNWKSVRSSGIDFDMAPNAPLTLAVAEIVVDRIYSRVVVRPDGKLNLQQLKGATPGQPDAPAPATEPKPRNVRIDRITFVDGRLNFTDLFIKPNYTADVGELQGSVNGLSSAPDTRATVDLKGRWDQSSPVLIAGTVNPLRGDLFLDIAAKGSDILLPKLSAYSARYAGYGITGGKLTLDVKYHVDGGKMEGRNKILVDQLTFGDKVEGPDATKLPVLFAVNLLKDSKGQINLELPVSGSLDDPQFEISGLVTQILGTLLKKAVTNPFGLLAAALGGAGGGGGGAASGDAAGNDLAYVEFEPGRSDLGEAQQKKLATLVKALQDRPGLKLELAAHADAKKDPEALRRAELQRLLVAMKRAEAGKGAKPDAPVTVDATEYPRYLKALYEREKPGKPAAKAESKDAREPPKEVTPAEMEAALLERITIGDEQLKALALARGEEAKSFLVASGRLPAERVVVAAAAADAAPSSRVDFGRR
jgi:hypothetical protein